MLPRLTQPFNSIVKSSRTSYLSTWSSLCCWQRFYSLSQGGYRSSKHHLTLRENIQKQEEKGKLSPFLTEKNPSQKLPSRLPLLPRSRSHSHCWIKSSLGKWVTGVMVWALSEEVEFTSKEKGRKMWLMFKQSVVQILFIHNTWWLK